MLNFLKPIPRVDQESGEKARQYIDSLTKPPGSLGRLEELGILLSEITRNPFPQVSPAGVIVFAADHGVAKEGVSAFPQEVTMQMVYNFVNGGAAINVFSRQIGAQFKIVDIGVNGEVESDAVIHKKVRNGTRNFAKEDALTQNEVIEAIKVGYDQASKMINKGIKCLIVGEMGIGNTTASSAILSVLSGKAVKDLVGIGTGITDEGKNHKIKVIEKAIQDRNANKNDAIDILSKLGGLEIAGMTGAMLCAAAHSIPILIDGFICTVSGLLAKLIDNNASDYFIIGHQSVEPGHDAAIHLLNKQPLINLNLRLGEGSGAVVAFPILQSACLMISEMATFENAGVSNK